MSQKTLAFTAATAFLLALGSTFWWAKSEHRPREAMQVATVFLKLLEEKRFAQAFEQTVKHGYVGKNPEELQAVSARELCEIDRIRNTFPYQSNGNRVRRLILGAEVEMPQVQVEFSGSCLLGVTLRRTPQNEWRVHRFARHAG